MPLVLANCVEQRNNSIGYRAAGGMLFGTILGVFVISYFLFILFQWLQEIKLS